MASRAAAQIPSDFFQATAIWNKSLLVVVGNHWGHTSTTPSSSHHYGTVVPGQEHVHRHVISEPEAAAAIERGTRLESRHGDTEPTDKNEGQKAHEPKVVEGVLCFHGPWCVLSVSGTTLGDDSSTRPKEPKVSRKDVIMNLNNIK
mmetsp:Transcript_29718/g.33338  ORF Transcript_29718/g.33338 Transcript_29718/m.33338 type:complete len:146 (+) Transcript_29718:256-693(+)